MVGTSKFLSVVWLAPVLAGLFLTCGREVRAAEWFVSPNGTASGMGTLQFPWDLQTALDGPAVVHAGDTIWLLGGTYYHPDRSNQAHGYAVGVSGSPHAPVTIRNYDGQRTTIDGGLHTNESSPSYVWIWGLEVVVSENFTDSRWTDEKGSNPDRGIPWGSINIVNGHDVKIINNIVHDNSQGIGFWKKLTGESELHGNIIYNNGWQGPDRYHGHAIYTQNYPENPNKYITDNFLLANYGRSMALYASTGAYLHNFYLEGNVSTTRPEGGLNGFLVGGESGPYNVEVRENIHYKDTLRIGYRDDGDDIRVFDNTVIRADIQYKNITNLVTSGNVTWDGEMRPLQPIVSLRPNKYEAKRANLTIIQPARALATIPVDLSSVLVPDDQFHLVEALDFFGAPVYSGTYTGGVVEIPVGRQEFSAYVVMSGPGSEPVVPREELTDLLIQDNPDYLAYSPAEIARIVGPGETCGWQIVDDPDAVNGKAIEGFLGTNATTVDATANLVFTQTGQYYGYFRLRTSDADSNGSLGNNDNVRTTSTNMTDPNKPAFGSSPNAASYQGVRNTSYQWHKFPTAYVEGGNNPDAFKPYIATEDLNVIYPFTLDCWNAGPACDVVIWHKNSSLTDRELGTIAVTLAGPAIAAGDG